MDQLIDMQQKRMPIYRAVSQIAIMNTGTIKQTAEAALEGFYEIAGD